MRLLDSDQSIDFPIVYVHSDPGGDQQERHKRISVRELLVIARRRRKPAEWFSSHVFCFGEDQILAFSHLLNEVGVDADLSPFRDKAKMKAVLSNSRVATAPFKVLLDRSEEKGILWATRRLRCGRHLIVKPTTGLASCSVRKIKREKDLLASISDVRRINRLALDRMPSALPGGVLIEEYVDGPEYSVDTVWRDGLATHCFVLAKSAPRGDVFPDRLYVYDPMIDPKLRAQLVTICQDAGSALNIRNGVTHTEIIVSPHGPIVIEVAARPGASGVFYRLFQAATGIQCLRLFFGLDSVESMPASHPRIAFWYNFPHEHAGRVRRTERFRHPDIEVVSEFVALDEGDFLPSPAHSMDYYYWIIGVCRIPLSVSSLLDRLCLHQWAKLGPFHL